MPAVTLFFELPNTQHGLATLQNWNQDWETLLQKGLITPFVVLSDMTNSWRVGIDELYLAYSFLHSSTCKIQSRMSLRAMYYYGKHHKIICGKPMNLETALASALPKVTPPGQEPSSPNGEAEVPLNVPPPEDGFQCSIALMKHIQYLNKFPKVDLLIRTGPASQNETQMDIPYPPVQSMFRIVRNEAMTTGSLIGVAMVCIELTLRNRTIPGCKDQGSYSLEY
ncbi:hypothetical protein CPB85DRAFT_1434723 [Mucidula mucida]|nr:hypothetical protein CPB85DRAFT_1434723 [Mucidula mucida]